MTEMDCFGDFNGQLDKCIHCVVAVECYEASEQVG